MMTYPVYRLFISGVCLALALGMYFVFTRTRLGMMIRAGSTNREMVQSWASTSVPVPRGVRRRRGHRGAGRHGGRAGVASTRAWATRC
jgi:hypothetical protein